MTLHHVATDPPVGGIRVEPINDSNGGGFVVCFVPESANKLHRAELVTNKPYFMRVGDDFVVMPPAVLRSMFYPRVSPRYTVEITCEGRNLHNVVGTFDFRLTIQNVGKATASEPYVVIHLEPSSREIPAVNHDGGWRLVPTVEWFGFRGSASIHPGATAPVIRVDFPMRFIQTARQLVVKCMVYSLNTQPATFSSTVDIVEILAGRSHSSEAVQSSD